MVDKWLFIRLASSVHRKLYQLTGGAIGARAVGPVLLLTTTGRRSGRLHTVPLLYVRDGPNWVVVASNAGAHAHPAWWLNLNSHPTATIQVRRNLMPVRAREADEDERRALWPQLLCMYPGYESYRQRARRRIPIVILQPTGQPNS